MVARCTRSGIRTGTGGCAERRAVRLAGHAHRAELDQPGRGTPSRRDSTPRGQRAARCRSRRRPAPSGPAPDTTAGTPSARRRRTSARVSGIAGSRWSWCSQSRVAASRCSGWPVRAATRSAARPELAAASACGTVVGQQPAGDRRSRRPVGGTKTTARDPRVDADADGVPVARPRDRRSRSRRRTRAPRCRGGPRGRRRGRRAPRRRRAAGRPRPGRGPARRRRRSRPRTSRGRGRAG